MQNIIVILIVAVIIGFAIHYIYKEKKRGVKCIGCPEGTTCSGCCAGCSGHCCGHANCESSK